MARPNSPFVLPLKGEIDLYVSPGIALSLAGITSTHPAHIIVDLTDVSYVDSSGLAVLIRGMQDVREYGGMFALAGLQQNVRTSFETARLDQVFQIFSTVDEALSVK